MSVFDLSEFGKILGNGDLPARLSVSALRDYNRCPQYFKLSRVDKHPRETQRHYMWAGNVVHAALESIYGVPVFDAGQRRPRWELADVAKLGVANEVFDSLWHHDPSYANDDRAQEVYSALNKELSTPPASNFAYGQLKATKSKNHLERRDGWRVQYSAMVGQAALLGYKYPVIDVERRVDYNVGGVPLLGYIDLVLKGPEGEIFVDLKSGRKPSDRELEWDDQIALYYLAGQPSSFWYHSLKAAAIYEVARNDELCRALELNTPEIMRQIQARNFPRRLSGDCAICDLRLTCMGMVGEEIVEPYLGEALL